MQAKILPNGMCLLNLERYINDIKSRLRDVADLENFKAPSTPFAGDPVSKKDCPDIEPGQNKLRKRYVEIIGILRWVERCCRPDLSVALSELGKVQANPSQKHFDQLIRCLRYTIATKSLGILYGRPREDDPEAGLCGFVDSNWGGTSADHRSRGGYIFMAWGSPICWSSFRATAIALSSCEAEFQAASIATQQATWCRYLASDMGLGDLCITDYGNLCSRDYRRSCLTMMTHQGEVPITIFEDNKAAILLSENHVFHKRSRSIHARYRYVRQHVRLGHVRLCYVETSRNLADLMTKTPPSATHSKLCDKLLCHLRGDKVYTFSGKLIDGPKRRGKRDEIRFPDLTRYRLISPADISDATLEERIREINNFDNWAQRERDARRGASKPTSRQATASTIATHTSALSPDHLRLITTACAVWASAISTTTTG